MSHSLGPAVANLVVAILSFGLFIGRIKHLWNQLRAFSFYVHCLLESAKLIVAVALIIVESREWNRTAVFQRSALFLLTGLRVSTFPRNSIITNDCGKFIVWFRTLIASCYWNSGELLVLLVEVVLLVMSAGLFAATMILSVFNAKNEYKLTNMTVTIAPTSTWVLIRMRQHFLPLLLLPWTWL